MKWMLLYFISSLIQTAVSIQIKLKSHIVQDDFTLDKVTHWVRNIPYSLPTMNLCFGTPNDQCFDLIISLSGYSLLERLNEYQSTMSKLFDSNHSTSFDYGTPRVSQGFYMQNVNSHYVLGDEVNDVVTFPNEPLRKSTDLRYKFILLRSNNSNKPLNIEGLLSLKKSSYVESFQTTDSFLFYLLNTTQINRLAFTLRYNSDKGDGLITFGEDQGEYRTCSSNLSNRDPGAWVCKLTEIQIEDEVIQLTRQYILFDTVRNYVIAPLVEGERIFNTLIRLSNKKCKTERDSDYFLLMCEEDVKVNQFPDIHLRMNEAEIVLYWRHLFKHNPNANEKNGNTKAYYVSLLLVNNDSDSDRHSYSWTIGIPGIIDNTILFDKDNLTIGILQSTIIVAEQKDNKSISRILTLTMLVLFIGIIINLLLKQKKINIFSIQ